MAGSHRTRAAPPGRPGSGAGQTSGFHRARVPIRARTFPAQTTRAMDMSHGPAESALPASIAGWLPAFIGLALAWGSSFFFAKVAVRELPPLYLTLGEDIAALSVLLAVLVASRQRLPRDRRLWVHLTALAVPTSASQILAAYGVQRVSSALAAILFATAPLLAFLFAALVFRFDRLTPTRVVGA